MGSQIWLENEICSKLKLIQNKDKKSDNFQRMFRFWPLYLTARELSDLCLQVVEYNLADVLE